MAAPRYREIWTEVKARLEAITVAGGYNYDLLEVGVGPVSEQSITNNVAVYLGEPAVTDRQYGNFGSGPNAMQAIAVIPIAAYARGWDDNVLALDLLKQDIAAAIEADPRNLGKPYALWAVVREVVPTAAEPAAQAPSRISHLEVAVRYGAPRGSL